MGAYKYVEELYKKKQSDVLRFLLRVRLVSDPPRHPPTSAPSIVAALVAASRTRYSAVTEFTASARSAQRQGGSTPRMWLNVTMEEIVSLGVQPSPMTLCLSSSHFSFCLHKPSYTPLVFRPVLRGTC
jgi:hypothetical protein